MDVVDNKALVLKTRTPHRVCDEIKRSKVVDEVGGMYRVAVYWGLDEAQALVSIGAKNVPSPLLRDYQWTGKFQPFAHQKETSSFLSLHKRAFCFSEAGVGKTASVIWTADYLMGLGRIKRVLVVCPLSIMKSAWQDDLFKFAMHRSCAVAHGDAKSRRKVLAGDHEFVIINFDGLGIVEQEIRDGGFDLVVVDECSYVKNSQTDRWKVLNRITLEIEWLWMLTGTPAAQSPLDAYGLAKLVCPHKAPKYYGRFRDMVMYKATQYVWKPKLGADKTVHALLQPAIRFEKRQCLDLPPVTHVFRDAPLSTQQRKYYELLRKKMVMEAAGEQVTSANAAVNLNKLLQISGGSVYTDTGEVVQFDVGNRLAVVKEVIEESSNKVLVFVPFSHTITMLHEYLSKNKISSEVISGQVAINKRTAIFKAFQETDTPKVLIIQPQAAAHGLTLTRADTTIWYAPVPSVETYLQANARMDRPGQNHAMTVVHIKGSTVEEKLYTMLQNNISNHDKIVELYREELTRPS